MPDELAIPSDGSASLPSAAGASNLPMAEDSSRRMDAPLGDPAGPRTPFFSERLHPLDRPDEERFAAEAVRIRLAWTKLIWLLSFLAVLLALAYLIPYIAEQTQYAMTRGKQRAEHDFAKQHLGASPLADLSRSYQMISQVVGPSVVHINTQGTSDNGILPLSTRRRGRMPAEGQGSGIIVDASGYILTNYHVIRDSHEIDVALSDGRKHKAQIIGFDRATDLAVLKIEADKLLPAEWGDSEQMEPGALVWAVGSPFGLERTITAGILSAKHRTGLASASQQDFLQTDAAVNPGNSGGPLVDSSGKVVGINTAIVGDAYQGISFAIPSNVARDIYEKLKVDQRVRRGWLGVQLSEITPELARQAGLPEPAGVYIAAIVEQANGSPAAKAGIQPGDVLLRWNDTTVSSPIDLRRAVERTEIGSRAKVTIFRTGRELTLEVVVGERPPLD